MRQAGGMLDKMALLWDFREISLVKFNFSEHGGVRMISHKFSALLAVVCLSGASVWAVKTRSGGVRNKVYSDAEVISVLHVEWSVLHVEWTDETPKARSPETPPVSPTIKKKRVPVKVATLIASDPRRQLRKQLWDFVQPEKADEEAESKCATQSDAQKETVRLAPEEQKSEPEQEQKSDVLVITWDDLNPLIFDSAAYFAGYFKAVTGNKRS